jgi:magnesium chelatase subunit D
MSRDRRFRIVPTADGGLRRNVPYRPELKIDVRATLVGRGVTGAPVLRSAVRLGRPPALTVLVVDLSGSMGGRRRIGYAKGLLARAMLKAYQRRHRFALVGFRGGPPCEVIEPTHALQTMLSRVDALRTGGATSIAGGLDAVGALIAVERRRLPSLVVNVVLITDGRATRSVRGRPPLEEALASARRLGELPGVQATVVDAEGGLLRLGLAAAVGRAMGASTEPLRPG